MKGIERRAHLLIADCGLGGIPEFHCAVVAVGGAAAAHNGEAHVLFHCAHGYGEFYLPASTWLRHQGDDDFPALILTKVAEHHAHKDIDTDRPEYNLVVTL